jgi:hypothetical protein
LARGSASDVQSIFTQRTGTQSVNDRHAFSLSVGVRHQSACLTLNLGRFQLKQKVTTENALSLRSRPSMAWSLTRIHALRDIGTSLYGTRHWHIHVRRNAEVGG